MPSGVKSVITLHQVRCCPCVLELTLGWAEKIKIFFSSRNTAEKLRIGEFKKG